MLGRRYYNLQDNNEIGRFTVLASGCSAKSRAAAQRANDPATRLAGRLAAASSRVTVHLSAMKQRLDALQPLQTAVTVLAQPVAGVAIEGNSSATPTV
jgi:hypothetical protein